MQIAVVDDVAVAEHRAETLQYTLNDLAGHLTLAVVGEGPIH